MRTRHGGKHAVRLCPGSLLARLAQGGTLAHHGLIQPVKGFGRVGEDRGSAGEGRGRASQREGQLFGKKHAKS